MKLHFFFFAIVACAVSACGSDANDVSTDSPDGINADNSTNIRPVTTPFNGFMLSEVIIDSERLSDSTRFYRYDSSQNTITYARASGANASISDAEIREIIELDENGLPLKISRFNDDEIVLTDSYSFNTVGQLVARELDFPITGDRPRRNNYLYHPDGQLAAEVTVDAATGLQLSATEYSYSMDGVLLSGDSGIATTQFTSDSQNRISGWMSENAFSDALTTATYTYDSNNNVTVVEISDTTGILSRTLNFSYVETTERIYNLVWFDYLYSPEID